MEYARTSALVSALAFGLSVTLAPSPATAARIVVQPGESIQAAIDAAPPGSTVTVMPGDYVENHGGTAAIRITKSLRLIAKSRIPNSRVRILPGPGQTDGILIEPENPGDPNVKKVTVQGFTVEGFSRNGIWTRYVENFKILRNESVNNLHNGIFPTLSAKGVLKKNVAYGSLDSGIWVEASEDVKAMRNEIFNNPTGFEVTVSKNIVARKNDVHHNTIGVGLYHPNAAPLPPIGDDGDWLIADNYIYANNFPNPVSGGLVGQLPSGGGVLILGVSRVTLRRNKITGHDFFGLASINYCIAMIGTSFDCSNVPPIANPAPRDNLFVDNVILDNALNPPSGGFGSLANDIIEIAGIQDAGNCYRDNQVGTSLPAMLPGC